MFIINHSLPVSYKQRVHLMHALVWIMHIAGSLLWHGYTTNTKVDNTSFITCSMAWLIGWGRVKGFRMIHNDKVLRSITNTTHLSMNPLSRPIDNTSNIGTIPLMRSINNFLISEPFTYINNSSKPIGTNNYEHHLDDLGMTQGHMRSSIGAQWPIPLLPTHWHTIHTRHMYVHTCTHDILYIQYIRDICMYIHAHLTTYKPYVCTYIYTWHTIHTRHMYVQYIYTWHTIHTRHMYVCTYMHTWHTIHTSHMYCMYIHTCPKSPLSPLHHFLCPSFLLFIPSFLLLLLLLPYFPPVSRSFVKYAHRNTVISNW